MEYGMLIVVVPLMTEQEIQGTDTSKNHIGRLLRSKVVELCLENEKQFKNYNIQEQGMTVEILIIAALL